MTRKGVNMSYHEWGDEWEHWDELYKAQRWMNDIFERCRKKYMHSKEKYGTIRYEYTYLWLENDEDWLTFKKIIRRAVRKFPNVAGEVVNELSSGMVADEYFHAWCAGINYYTTGSCWADVKGIKGFYNDDK